MSSLIFLWQSLFFSHQFLLYLSLFWNKYTWHRVCGCRQSLYSPHFILLNSWLWSWTYIRKYIAIDRFNTNEEETSNIIKRSNLLSKFFGDEQKTKNVCQQEKKLIFYQSKNPPALFLFVHIFTRIHIARQWWRGSRRGLRMVDRLWGKYKTCSPVTGPVSDIVGRSDIFGCLSTLNFEIENHRKKSGKEATAINKILSFLFV